MRTKVGLWIDHRKAIIVAVTDKGEEIGLIISKVEKQLRRSGDSTLLRVPTNHSKYRQMTAAREHLRDISTFTTMR
jgi:hypothetical protein